MTEKEVLQYWKENKIFQKSLKRGDRDFVFYEGPPSANGRPGIHHTETRAFKDAVCRFQSMTGARVERKAGWDTQGLPIENQVAKELNLSGKKAIEQYGIAKFNQKCREIVWGYKKEWEEVTDRFGFWLDLDNPYITYESKYIESLWGVFAKIASREVDGQSLVYQDYKVVPHCPSCETTLSSHEVAQGYKDVHERSVYIKFPVLDQKNTYFLVWTTTPWTLPGNIALAVKADATYIRVKVDSEVYILEKENAKKLEFVDFDSQEYSGKELTKMSYLPLFELDSEFLSKSENDYKVYTADFVTTDEGTGIVHIAPAFGEDDFALAGKENLSKPITADTRGIITAKVPGNGLFIKDADEHIIKDLTERNLFFRAENVEHTYPFCWRCDSPLMYLLKPSWFIAMSKLRTEIMANNAQINWIPEYIKNGRFGNFLEELKDWAISREKYWGTPLPIWVCNECKNRIVISSFNELEQLSNQKFASDFDPHRPFIDDIEWDCECKEGKMKRVPEVMDVWFDSGAMPYASGEYDRKRFPADFIAEAIDQTRGWFYTLLAISTALDLGPSYKNVITLGLVLDKQGKKMSKSRGNIVLPMEIMDKYSADALRWYFYTINQPAELKRFEERDILAISRGYLASWNNLLNFYNTYSALAKDDGEVTLLDQWMEARLDQTTKIVREAMNQYDLVTSARTLQELLEDISNWYLRRSRKRMTGIFFDTFRKILIESSKLSAPFTPFISESIYQKLNSTENSVHLEDFPVEKNNINTELLQKMSQIRNFASLALSQRAEKGIKVRQPLAKFQIPNSVKFEEELLQLLSDEINVKKIEQTDIKEPILDYDLSEELIVEGNIAELTRQIQVLRKNNNLKPADKVKIAIGIVADSKLAKYFDQIETSTNVQLIIDPELKEGNEIKFDDLTIFLSLRK